jgi:hypothetical protein
MKEIPLDFSDRIRVVANVLDGAGNKLRGVIPRRGRHHSGNQLRVGGSVARTEHAVDLLPGKLQTADGIAHGLPPSCEKGRPATT